MNFKHTFFVGCLFALPLCVFSAELPSRAVCNLQGEDFATELAPAGAKFLQIAKINNVSVATIKNLAGKTLASFKNISAAKWLDDNRIVAIKNIPQQDDYTIPQALIIDVNNHKELAVLKNSATNPDSYIALHDVSGNGQRVVLADDWHAAGDRSIIGIFDANLRLIKKFSIKLDANDNLFPNVLRLSANGNLLSSIASDYDEITQVGLYKTPTGSEIFKRNINQGLRTAGIFSAANSLLIVRENFVEARLLNNNQSKSLPITTTADLVATSGDNAKFFAIGQNNNIWLVRPDLSFSKITRSNNTQINSLSIDTAGTKLLSNCELYDLQSLAPTASQQ